jgi:hypothetical protein
MVKLANTAKRSGMLCGSKSPMIREAGMFPIQEKDIYIWKTVADNARGVASPISAIRPPALIRSRKFESIARMMNQVIIPRLRVIQR